MKRNPLASSTRALELLGAVALSSAMLLAAPSSALAGEGSSPQSSPDFRFSSPSNTFGLRAGWVIHRADSEIYDFVSELLTLESSSFNGPAFAMDFGFRLSSRLDAVLGFEYSNRKRRSEYRDWVDENGIPIVQDSRLTQVPLTLSLKFYLVDRGRSVGQYAWVPTSVVPYIGGGGGMTWYRFEQVGEFVDFIDLAIFEDVFRSDGWTPSLHAFAGVDIKLNPSLGLVLEGRYQWASKDMSGSFVGFDPIDLSGLRLMAGVHWKF
jgi:opacity protein-like surface antigen